jgi:hypothetical protein
VILRRWTKVIWAICALFCAVPALAIERVTCWFEPAEAGSDCVGGACLGAPVALRFEIDPNQFLAPHALGEPPRGKVALVSLEANVFEAEPIRMADGTRGFPAKVAGVEHLMTTGPDGLARYASTGAVPFLRGRCEVTR